MKFYSVFFAICLMFMLSMPTYAYLDPSIASYTIQAVAGIVIAIGAGIGIYWRKMKRKAMDKLGIDENAKKEIEEEVIEFTEEKRKGLSS